jgi:hypothetical protein
VTNIEGGEGRMLVKTPTSALITGQIIFLSLPGPAKFNMSAQKFILISRKFTS